MALFFFFLKKYREQKMCVLIFSTAFLSDIFLILTRIQRDIIINVHRSLPKGPVIFVRFYTGADKSLARPGRKQANVSVRMA